MFAMTGSDILPNHTAGVSPMLDRMVSNPEAVADLPLLEQVQTLEHELEAIQRKRDLFLSEERAWRDALGWAKLEEFENTVRDLEEKVQAAEQDLLDFSQGAAEVVERCENLLEEREEEYQTQEQFNADATAECQSLQERKKSMACRIASDSEAEKELISARRLLTNQLKALSQADTIDADLMRSQQHALKKLANARRSCTTAQTRAAQAEAALRRARCSRSTQATKSTTASEGVLVGTSHNSEDPRLDEIRSKSEIWSGLCEKGQANAKAWQNRAEKAAMRQDEAEAKAKEAQADLEFFMPGLDTMTAQVSSAKHDLERACWQQKMVCGIMSMLVLLILMQLCDSTWLPLSLGQDAPAFLFFAAGIVIMAFARTMPSMLRNHIHAKGKVSSKVFSDEGLVFAGNEKSKKC
mmetsp:Transcript_10597/g.19593  ORF Transcript_10597/g.19593 Transcript_10597/m.19593 type:complete len:411 (-) Transcript_10597:115-1347(-)